MSKKYTLTAALPYANGALHLGHLAGAYLPADIYARFLRRQGKDLAFVCGSDEHGAAITIRAKKEGRSPQEIIDHYHALNKKTFEQLGISFDIYHRTSSELHHKTAQDFFLQLLEKGDQFEQKTTEQYYDEDFKQFLADRYIQGTCPKCGHEEAFGDQCEKCGSTLSPTELINPISTMSGKTPVLKETTHWYFRLDQHEAWLKEWVEKGQLDGQQLHDPTKWRKHVLGQCLSWIEGGLQARAITRDLDWGIKLPIENAEGKVLYVWFDAPLGYISATKAWAEEQGKNWEDYWKGEDTELIHFIGKDNIVFHCVVFPAMLKAAGDYILPKNVPANQFLNLEGKKFSKSRGWVIEQHQYLQDFAEFPNKEDALRYALIRSLPENKDGDFKWEEFVALHDNELADNLGNFFNRVLSFIKKYSAGKLPAADLDLLIQGSEVGSESSYKKVCQTEILPLVERLEKEIMAFEFRQAIQTVLELSRLGNGMFQNNSPWKLAKENPEAAEVQTVLALGVQIAACLNILLEPFLPFVAQKMEELLNWSADLDMASLKEKLAAGQSLLAVGHTLAAPKVIFAKINNKKDKRWSDLIAQQEQLLQDRLKALEAEAKRKAQEEANQKRLPEIEFDDFTKVEMRLAKVISAKKVKKADRLLEIEVDLGGEKRTVVSGLAKCYTPEEILGQQVVMVVNLKPRKLRGIVSQGMILTAENPDGSLSLLQPWKGMQDGALIK
ncbi:protein containing C-terminal region/beta chain of methionyl-tRNA synthetase [Saprospira grandis DSM 2844]|uniref:Methionine--tRNA ligase n=1 Tax=Saprospira grandis DSM 2844 TaxID=694433 RepID=J1I0R9_9BACT|nr:methionine--tRNA ligase [Saprospira grandis]EJF52255.1 protein containing C-terminal region/beta chain of methionyl-tRNA synthetase [Saprospira grandis DSM 2844]